MAGVPRVHGVIVGTGHWLCWSGIVREGMTAKYAHVLPEVMTDAADRIGQALWGSPDQSTATGTATRRPDGSAKR